MSRANSTIAFLAIWVVFVFDVSAQNSQELMTEAFNHFNAGDYEAAISKAEECVSKFKATANVLQKALQRAGEQPPNVYLVNKTIRKDSQESKDLKDEIFSRGSLNDVPACYWVIGGAWKALGNTEKAINAYHQASNYIYGLTWDPEGYFWHPAEDAKERADELEKRKK